MDLILINQCENTEKKKINYKRINNHTREKLIDMVYLRDYMLKDAAKMLNINYSTAKTILRVFRKEKRIDKKNSKKHILNSSSKKAKFQEDSSNSVSEEENLDKLNNSTGSLLIIIENVKDYEPFATNLKNTQEFIKASLENINMNQLIINAFFENLQRIGNEINEISRKSKNKTLIRFGESE